MVKLKVSFDKSWGKINENEIKAAIETLWGKLAQEKWELLSLKYNYTQLNDIL
jgi:hypothetical protein